MTQKQMERKQFDAVITAIDETQGIVKAVFAVMGNVDEGHDRIWPGAFSKTFVERGGKVLVLDNHNTGSTTDVVAKPLALKELTRNQLPPEILEKYPDATGGAEITAQFEPDKNKDERSAAAFYRLKNGWVKSWSFGYDAMDYDFTTEQVGTKEVQVRNLRTIKLYEASPVLFPMNDAAMTTDAKSAQPTEGKPYRAVHEDGKWRVYKLDAEGKPTGKPLGEHDTEEEAGAQVRALYANTDEGKAVTRSEADGAHPASHYLIVEDAAKPTTWHLRVMGMDGKPDHRLMGAAWAALHGGYRGNVYEGPGKQEAIRKLTALYESEGIPTPGKSDNPEDKIKSGRVLSSANAGRIRAHIQGLQKQINEMMALLSDAGISDDEDQTDETTGPLKSAPAPTSTEAGPQSQQAAPDYLKLIEIQRQRAALWR